jgi:hypothetical protein
LESIIKHRIQTEF